MKAKYWASETRGEVLLGQHLDIDDIKYIENQEAMLVLKWYRKDSFYMSHSQENEVIYNPFYDCSVEIIVYTQEHIINLASYLEQDWMDYIRSDWDSSWHTFDKAYALLPLNQLYAELILSTMAKDKLAWFFQERILGFVQIPVVVSLEVFCKLKSKINNEEVYRLFGNALEMRQIGRALEFEKTISQGVLEDKFYFLSRKLQEEKNAFLLQKSRIYQDNLSKISRFHSKNTKELWYFLLSQNFPQKQKRYNLLDLRPDYIKEGGIWMCVRAFFEIHSCYPKDEDKIMRNRYEQYILKNRKKFVYNAFLGEFVRFVCDVNINSGAKKTSPKMLIALPFYEDIEKFGYFTDGDTNCAAWLNWLEIREKFMQNNPKSLNPNECVIFATNILENDIARVKICEFDVLNPKEPNLHNLNQIILEDCYMSASHIIPLPNFTRDEGGIMYPSSQYPICMFNAKNQKNVFFKEV
ncbi:hypothetical protein [Helicobacter sp. MIT 05-5294]|uniref:hypothetical protein n=1 Tax=Helicobacter sp. MIT 05-5294 TaxID=1548150 RepID=UPI00051FE085|nr:hypothetical protein [Helicobacter sp. MIT 05-5294]TLD84233.1 hypothetical protein LS69_009965 [Helicobacter sp. MIT 05-5294]